jgi:hypothetical protein
MTINNLFKGSNDPFNIRGGHPWVYRKGKYLPIAFFCNRA